MRTRPEQTQLEGLSDASFLGKLLALPANVRLDWKVLPGANTPAFFGLIISKKEKKFYNIDSCSKNCLILVRLLEKDMKMMWTDGGTHHWSGETFTTLDFLSKLQLAIVLHYTSGLYYKYITIII